MSYLIWNRNGNRDEISRAPEDREEEILMAIGRIDMSLSPECLSCDGELPRSEQRRRARELMARRDALEKELGRKVESQY